MALPTDELLSRAAAASIRKHVPIVIDALKVIVQAGYVTLHGHVNLAFLSSRAEKVVRELPGVTGLANNIVVTPLLPRRQPVRVQNLRPHPSDVQVSGVRRWRSASGQRVLSRNQELVSTPNFRRQPIRLRDQD
jgi:hypothetical protein